MFVCCECCVLSGRGFCDGLITRPGESYRLWCVVVCGLETSSRMKRTWPALGCGAIGGGVMMIMTVNIKPWYAGNDFESLFSVSRQVLCPQV